MLNRTLNVGFAGTPEFARVALEQLIAAGFPVRLVFTQPDRPAGRGLKLSPSPVKQEALKHQIPVLQPVNFREEALLSGALAAIANAAEGRGLDVLVVAAYGLILPQRLLDAPRLGCLNIHGSLLPRWRGAAPIHRAIEAGDEETGVCIMQMEAGLDTGPVRLSRGLHIQPDDTTAKLHDQLAELGGALLIDALDLLQQGRLPLVPQPQAGVTYASKISKTEGQIDWYASALDLQRRLRAFDPFPGASTVFQGEVLKCFKPWLLAPSSQQGEVGQVLSVSSQGIDVQCGQGVLRIETLQRSGGKRAPAHQVALGLSLSQGQRFDCVEKDDKP